MSPSLRHFQTPPVLLNFGTIIGFNSYSPDNGLREVFLLLKKSYLFTGDSEFL